MGIRRHKPEEIVTKLRQVEVLCGQPVEFILDEACNAKAALSNLIDDLTLVRGLSARVHLAAQAESQIVTTWGRDAAKTLDAVTDLKQIMGTNSPEEAQILSKALAMGVIDFEELGFSTKSEDVTLRADRTGRPLMTPDEILSMPRDEQIILVNGLRPKGRLEDCIELSLKFLSSPWSIWKNGDFAMRQAVLRLAFAEPLRYSQNGVYETPNFSFPFKFLGGVSGSKSEMVLLGRIELPPKQIISMGYGAFCNRVTTLRMG